MKARIILLSALSAAALAASVWVAADYVCAGRLTVAQQPAPLEVVKGPEQPAAVVAEKPKPAVVPKAKKAEPPAYRDPCRDPFCGGGSDSGGAGGGGKGGKDGGDHGGGKGGGKK